MFKSLRNKLSKNKKGFTLVELMIVIAIIGILAIVLIPQASKMRENAKLSGVDANARMVQAQIEAVIDDSNNATDVQTALKTRLGASIKNPFDTNQTGVYTPASAATTTSVGAVAIYANVANPDTYFSTVSADANFSGEVVVSVTGSGKDLKAYIFEFDQAGSPRTPSGKAKVVTK